MCEAVDMLGELQRPGFHIVHDITAAGHAVRW